MNMNVIGYRLLNNTINEHKMYEMFFSQLPICAISAPMFEKGIELEERARLARTGIDRARFLAKHDRSKYTPHTGLKQLIKAGASVLDKLPQTLDVSRHYQPEDNT